MQLRQYQVAILSHISFIDVGFNLSRHSFSTARNRQSCGVDSDRDGVRQNVGERVVNGDVSEAVSQLFHIESYAAALSRIN